MNTGDFRSFTWRMPSRHRYREPWSDHEQTPSAREHPDRMAATPLASTIGCGASRTVVLTPLVATRNVYQRSLSGLWVEMADLARRDARAIDTATRALAEADQDAADEVIAAQAGIVASALALEDRAIRLIAREQPVASDLRLVTGTFMMSSALSRMGGLAQHVAQTARMRTPRLAVTGELHDVFAAMGRAAVTTANSLTSVLEDRDASAALALRSADDVMDGLHRSLFTKILTLSSVHIIEEAIDAALLGRFYERFADQAVTVARRAHYILTAT